MTTLARSSRVAGLNEMSDAEVALNDANDAQRKAQEREAKKAEVRRRLEEAGNKNKNKKGFLTPERKKKLRKLLMVKAAEDLKRQQVEKEKERQRILAERTVALPDVDSVDDKAKLEAIFKDLEQRVFQLEGEKYDINYEVSQRDAVINALTIEVNDLRGKYVKPSLKKVSKYDNKFKKTAEAAAAAQGEKKLDFRASLKVVKKDVMDEITNIKKKDDKPEWSKKKDHEKKEEEHHEVAEKEEEIPTEKHEEEEEIEEDEEDEE